jgi:hypothetical protein
MPWYGLMERLRNALHGFGPITDAEVRREVDHLDEIPQLDMGARQVSQWGTTRYLKKVDP